MHATKQPALARTEQVARSANGAAAATLHHWRLAHEPARCEQRLEAVAAGYQRASAALVWELQKTGATVPAVGDLLLLDDVLGRRRAVVEVVERRVVPFAEVDELFAADMGEGDLSLRHWREIHWEAFARSALEAGHAPSGSMPVLTLRFQLVDPERATPRCMAPGDGRHAPPRTKDRSELA